MNFELIDIWSTECDVETFNPYADPHNYEFPERWIILLNMTIGYNGAGHHYSVYVCTIEYVRRSMPFFSDDKIIIVDEWDLDKIKSTINKVIKHCTCDTPEDTFKQLAKCFYWEFQDYKPYPYQE